MRLGAHGSLMSERQLKVLTLYLRSKLYSKETDDFVEVNLVDYFGGRPVYMDDEGKLYCPFKNEWEVAPPLQDTPEYGLWTRIARYIQEVLKRIVS